jgi:cupin 2 domain-containing protein
MYWKVSMDHQANNIFQKTPKDLHEELIEVLLETKAVRIERIVSKGHASPPGFWYDQDRDEFVILLDGSAGLLFEEKEELIVMKPGDHVNIPAHARHRVEWTDPSEETVWMAVFY